MSVRLGHIIAVSFGLPRRFATVQRFQVHFAAASAAVVVVVWLVYLTLVSWLSNQAHNRKTQAHAQPHTHEQREWQEEGEAERGNWSWSWSWNWSWVHPGNGNCTCFGYHADIFNLYSILSSCFSSCSSFDCGSCCKSHLFTLIFVPAPHSQLHSPLPSPHRTWCNPNWESIRFISLHTRAASFFSRSLCLPLCLSLSSPLACCCCFLVLLLLLWSCPLDAYLINVNWNWFMYAVCVHFVPPCLPWHTPLSAPHSGVFPLFGKQPKICCVKFLRQVAACRHKLTTTTTNYYGAWTIFAAS